MHPWQRLTPTQKFIPKLKDYIITRLLHQEGDATDHSFSNKERAKLIILLSRHVVYSILHRILYFLPVGERGVCW